MKLRDIIRLREEVQNAVPQNNLFPDVDPESDDTGLNQTSYQQNNQFTNTTDNVRKLPTASAMSSILVGSYNRNPEFTLNYFFKGNIGSVFLQKNNQNNSTQKINQEVLTMLSKLDGLFAIPLLVYGPQYGYLRSTQEIESQLANNNSFLRQCITTGTVHATLSPKLFNQLSAAKLSDDDLYQAEVEYYEIDNPVTIAIIAVLQKRKALTKKIAAIIAQPSYSYGDIKNTKEVQLSLKGSILQDVYREGIKLSGIKDYSRITAKFVSSYKDLSKNKFLDYILSNVHEAEPGMKFKLSSFIRKNGYTAFYMGLWSGIIQNLIQDKKNIVINAFRSVTKTTRKTTNEDIQVAELSDAEIAINQIASMENDSVVSKKTSVVMHSFYKEIEEKLLQQFYKWKEALASNYTSYSSTESIQILDALSAQISNQLSQIAITTHNSTVEAVNLVPIVNFADRYIQAAFSTDKDTRSGELDLDGITTQDESEPQEEVYNRTVVSLQLIKNKIEQYINDGDGIKLSGPQFVELYRNLSSIHKDYAIAFAYETKQSPEQGDFVFVTLTDIFTDIIVLKIYDRIATVFLPEFHKIISTTISEEKDFSKVLKDAKTISYNQFIDLFRTITSSIDPKNKYMQNFVKNLKERIDTIDIGYTYANNIVFGYYERAAPEKQKYEELKTRFQKFIDNAHKNFMNIIQRQFKKITTSESRGTQQSIILLERGQIPDTEDVLRYYQELTKSLLSTYQGNKFDFTSFGGRDSDENLPSKTSIAQQYTQTPNKNSTTTSPTQQSTQQSAQQSTQQSAQQSAQQSFLSKLAPRQQVEPQDIRPQDNITQQSEPAQQSQQASKISTSIKKSTVNDPGLNSDNSSTRSAAINRFLNRYNNDYYGQLEQNTQRYIDSYLPTTLSVTQKPQVQNYIAVQLASGGLKTDDGKPVDPETVAVAIQKFYKDYPGRDIKTVTIQQLLSLYRSYFERSKDAKPDLRWGVSELKTRARYIGDNYYLLSLSEEFNDYEFRLNIDNMHLLERMFGITIKYYGLKSELAIIDGSKRGILTAILDIRTLDDISKLDENLESVRFIYVNFENGSISIGQDITKIEMRKIDSDRTLDQVVRDTKFVSAMQKQKIVGVVKMIQNLWQEAQESGDYTRLLSYLGTKTDNTNTVASNAKARTRDTKKDKYTK